MIGSALSCRFTHSLTSLPQVARLFDVMLLHPLMPLYIAASVVLHFKKDLQTTEERYQVYQILGVGVYCWSDR